MYLGKGCEFVSCSSPRPVPLYTAIIHAIELYISKGRDEPILSIT